MDIQEVFSIASQGLGIALVVGGAIFGFRSIWPWWERRDEEERERRHELLTQKNTTAEMAATHLAVIAHSLTNQIRVKIEPNSIEPG